MRRASVEFCAREKSLLENLKIQSCLYDSDIAVNCYDSFLLPGCNSIMHKIL